MANLKEEWAELMKLRESGYADISKREEIKSRIFNNFYSVRQENVKDVPYLPQIAVKSEFEHMRGSFLAEIASSDRPKTPEIPKKYEFGLKNVTPPPSQHRANRVDIRSEEIWAIPDKAFTAKCKDPLEDRFEINSIAEVNPAFVKPLNQQKEIQIFTDLSPVTRYLATMMPEEEEKYLKGVNKGEKYIWGIFHLSRKELKLEEIESLDWKITSDAAKGLIFSSDILQFKPVPQKKNTTIISDPGKSTISQCYSEPPLLLDTSILKNTGLKNSSSTVPFVNTSQDTSLLEKDLQDMMDVIRSQKNPAGYEKKLGELLEKTRSKLGNDKESSQNMQLRVLYQFLLEFQRSKAPEKKSLTPKRTVQPKPTQKRNIPAVKTKTLQKIESASSTSSIKSNKWIGGGKFKGEIDDEDWVSANPEKKKKESRNEMLYKLSMKPVAK